MLERKQQLELNFSSYSELYNIVVKPDNFWRQLNDMVDFSFIYEELKDNYSSNMGRTCEDIVRMFKYLLLKSYFKLSDRGLVERAETDLLFKYFLGYAPEETKLINPSLLTVFRRERLKVNEKNLMDKLINKTVEIAFEKGLIEVKNKIIVDSTHTNAMFHHISPREELIRQAKELRKSIYKMDESMYDKMSKKKETIGILENQIDYTKKLLKIIKEDGIFTALSGIKEQIDYLEKTMNDTEIELEYSKDQDAKVGHKTADTSFFEYKTHIAQIDYMKTEEFKIFYKGRYKIETKNAELKNNYNYGNASSCGKLGITIQEALCSF